MPDARPESSSGDKTVEFVGFWYRLGSVLWDGLLLIVVLGAALGMLVGQALDQESGQRFAATLVVVAVPAYTLCCWILYGRTLGKWLCSQRIVATHSGQTPGALRCLLRLAAWPLGALLWPLMLRDRYRRTLHDRIAGTCVIADGSMRAPDQAEGQVRLTPPWTPVSRQTAP